LVETVKGYAAHERETFEEVTRARSMVEQAGDVGSAADANNMLTGALRHLFAVAEGYPDLKANQNFLDLQRELSDIEEKIAYARQFYNRNVMSYNTSIQTFPNVLMANMFGFLRFEFFEAEEEAREVPGVSFAAPPEPPATPPSASEPPASPPEA
jgi:LemA protein